MDKEYIILPIILVFIVFYSNVSRKGFNVSSIYLVRKTQMHLMKNFYVMLMVSLLINLVALVLLKSNSFTSGIAISIIMILLVILQFAIFLATY